MANSSTNGNDTQYGLTTQIVLSYSDAVRCGFDWSLAMQHLKTLYENNKSLYYYEHHFDLITFGEHIDEHH